MSFDNENVFHIFIYYKKIDLKIKKLKKSIYD